jgi:hypothetical protein
VNIVVSHSERIKEFGMNKMVFNIYLRDFNNDGKINVQGDFNVTDNSHEEH